MSNKFELGKTYVVVKPFHYHAFGDEFTVERITPCGDVRTRTGNTIVSSSDRIRSGYVN